MKCEICQERKATKEGFYYGERVNGCEECLKQCDTDSVYYYVDELYKCFNCSELKHEDHYDKAEDMICSKCKQEIEEDDSYFPYRHPDV